MPAEYDESQWPLVRVRWSAAITDAQHEDFFNRLDGWLNRGEFFGLLLDSRGAQGFTSAQRDRTLGYMRSHAAATGRLMAQAVVIDNAIQRALYFAISWAFPMPFPSKTFADVDAASAWLQLLIRDREHRKS